ncbi:hypothetical protein BOTCAL_1163g00010 [Botryotinia calthae]|uniref:Transposase Tc1-like domain-containing protein n=1 Tax=Botryotinia calthae TaxID=38488 RepID=A0A4Y8CDB6_9HELO|nr:hypothetical protein BOTCAL_1163g00010 [Botryotinia calthae]
MLSIHTLQRIGGVQNDPYKRLTPYIRGKIVSKAEEGLSSYRISKGLGLARGTIRYTLLQDLVRNDGICLPRASRSRSYTERDERMLLRYIRLSPKATYKQVIQEVGLDCSVTTIKRILTKYGIANWRCKKRPELTPAHAAKRLEWCLAHRGLTVEEWRLVV